MDISWISNSTTWIPGYGYWIKLTGAGQIIIPEASAKVYRISRMVQRRLGKNTTNRCSRSKLHLVCSKGRSRLKSV